MNLKNRPPRTVFFRNMVEAERAYRKTCEDMYLRFFLEGNTYYALAKKCAEYELAWATNTIEWLLYPKRKKVSKKTLLPFMRRKKHAELFLKKLKNNNSEYIQKILDDLE